MSRSPRRGSGFTVAEALIALAVLSFGILSAWKMHGTVYKYDSVSDRISSAVSLATEEAEILKNTGYDSLNNGQTDKVVIDSRNRSYRLKTTISDTANGTNKRIVLTVGWQDGGSLPADIDACKRHLTIRTLVSDLG
ncbi:MAG: hypothetical protein K9K79_00800 [Desulfohalobiaceae bacterium]|nr:hypothetical protein [Desulfohalobiaceae bacterium]